MTNLGACNAEIEALLLSPDTSSEQRVQTCGDGALVQVDEAILLKPNTELSYKIQEKHTKHIVSTFFPL